MIKKQFKIPVRTIIVTYTKQKALFPFSESRALQTPLRSIAKDSLWAVQVAWT